MKTKVLKALCAMLACVLMVSAIVCGKQKVEEKVPEITQTEKAETEKVEAEADKLDDEEAKVKVEVETQKAPETAPVVTTEPVETVKPEVTPEPVKPEITPEPAKSEVKPETSKEPEKPAESKPPVNSQEPSQPAEPVVPEEPAHEHNWVPITVPHEEIGHYDIQYGERKVVKCGCGQNFYDNESFYAHSMAGTGDCDSSSSLETEKYEVGKTWVVDQPAWDEVVGYNCECGATKDVE